ncbi:hypothetical protein A2962_01635 [Candidatus Woesebacteria bacterium RIFCSPLOWO2_01_FULL_39_61]|uniref:Uncharacterized protein n=1 Tax=Candidatus Woesebacteria bacterium RIFCSPHIGHO2_02_FULL_39_13 TaxID=1802505 RepID=A0A1F7Z4H4_9BACT|nr:MAG: hypothetical protein A2692_01875 [Candidatus Woesebacteria bacterium RIFCSPHIGHO2_01_FULL_39_95]OGM34546.1 MAG: hypothetical protein A3D01_03325 [Candidatus Woesebacteria bacterium RIFCSPHIGHO2_02_FULL_39_13]OGM38813.1 MAG: hypothetical protein A3E13_01220 [Candidatus Woesebacteria bacterium RIFCSPHIGHO2_12_FULL_40_20]OGM65819.1 MAG: hypothetical protein A2962_01635 [Candidatus Woesebacteria bacterium RIFCSPLOWO2_01_FULL_39_61]OGM71632.1 MAG: hypothetical protein A3H19_04935 [Candidatus
MDQEHPIPQQISAYQFRLVGDMTLKQFFQVAAGVLISLVIYSSGLTPYIKWPLIILSFLAGIAFAFFPLEDRPLSKWLFLFVKAIYSPTIYTWKKKVVEPQFFQPEPISQPTSMPQTPAIEDLATKQAPVPSLEPSPKEFQKFEQREKEFMSKVSEQFESAKKVELGGKAPRQVPLDNDKVKVPQVPALTVEKTEKKPVVPIPELSVSDVGSEITASVGQRMNEVKLAEFSPEAAPPTPPTKSNIVVGQVIDSKGMIIENAILEIKDPEGRSVRALKSNKLGHFMIVTPLANGKYEIITEKEGFTFEPISFEARGDIIPPVFVKANQIEANLATNQPTMVN